MRRAFGNSSAGPRKQPCESAARNRWAPHISDARRRLALRLPSGRFLRYLEARLERAKGRAYENVVFRHRERQRPGYGGLWTENAVQAIARDIIAAALVRLEAVGLDVVLHVHDEVVCELDATSAEAGLLLMGWLAVRRAAAVGRGLAYGCGLGPSRRRIRATS